jgi:hypothetical protein
MLIQGIIHRGGDTACNETGTLRQRPGELPAGGRESASGKHEIRSCGKSEVDATCGVEPVELGEGNL